MLPEMINLSPQDISLDTCRDTDFSERLGDHVSAELAVEIPFYEGISNTMLERVQPKRNNPVRIVDILNRVL